MFDLIDDFFDAIAQLLVVFYLAFPVLLVFGLILFAICGPV